MIKNVLNFIWFLGIHIKNIKGKIELENKRLKIFFLDDNMTRYLEFYHWIENKTKDPKIETAENVEEAKEVFSRENDFDVIFLDHDLGGRIFVDSDEDNTGYQVAKYIKEKDIKYNQLFIHSQNPTGARNIYNLLKDENNEGDVRILPFNEMIKS